MICPNCGSENQAGSQYCDMCGSVLPVSTTSSNAAPQHEVQINAAPQTNLQQNSQRASAGAWIKAHKGLVIGLGIGLVTLIAGLIVLLVFLGINQANQHSNEVKTEFEKQAVYMNEVPSNDYVRESDYAIKEYSYDGAKQNQGQNWADGKVTAKVANENFEVDGSWYVYRNEKASKDNPFNKSVEYSFSYDSKGGGSVRALKGVDFISKENPDKLKEQNNFSSDSSSSSSSSSSGSGSSYYSYGGSSSSSSSSTQVNSIGAKKGIDPASFTATLNDDNTKCEAVANYAYNDMWFSDATETDNYHFTFKKSDSSGKYGWTKESEQNNDTKLTNIYKELNGSYLAQGSKDVKSFKVSGLDASAGTFTVSGHIVYNSNSFSKYKGNSFDFSMNVSIKPATSIVSPIGFKKNCIDAPFADGYYYEFAGSGANISTIKGIICLANDGSRALYISEMRVKNGLTTKDPEWSPNGDSWNRLLIKQ